MLASRKDKNFALIIKYSCCLLMVMGLSDCLQFIIIEWLNNYSGWR
ncbi:hypothetical protein HMPREF0201_02433 [Cedecea davisae DSM 4568]|uniref:Uncharacterized protein n=1 Tax=Cedecea davisae DSM 4568 TaxID=566551 RepID=S3J9A3_9ENTR|nr:hypothetical protein HMPREF0201_02433 [Cedecea davisae DSM 4568]